MTRYARDSAPGALAPDRERTLAAYLGALELGLMRVDDLLANDLRRAAEVAALRRERGAA